MRPSALECYSHVLTVFSNKLGYSCANNHQTLIYINAGLITVALRIYVFCLIRDLVDKLPSPHTFLLLGDAYINIQEVGEVLVVYSFVDICVLVKIFV